MENLIVYQKMLELTEYAYIALRQFPKSEKFGLAADIKNQLREVLILGCGHEIQHIFQYLISFNNPDKILNKEYYVL